MQHYSVFCERELANRDAYRVIISLYIQLSHDYIAPWVTLQQGRLVHVLAEHIRHGSMEHSLWVGYGHRLARGWNALRLAAWLCGLVPETPWYALVDRLCDLGELRLAEELRLQFVGDPVGWRDTGDLPPLAPLPPGTPPLLTGEW